MAKTLKELVGFTRRSLVIGNVEFEDTKYRLRLTSTDKQPARFLATIKQRSKNLIHEGAAPLSVATDKSGQVWSLTNSDYNYKSPYASVALSDIEYVEVLLLCR